MKSVQLAEQESKRRKKKASGRGGTFSLLQCDMHVHLLSDLLAFSLSILMVEKSTVCNTSSPVYSKHMPSSVDMKSCL